MKKIGIYLVYVLAVVFIMLALLVEPSHLQSWAILHY